MIYIVNKNTVEIVMKYYSQDPVQHLFGGIFSNVQVYDHISSNVDVSYAKVIKDDNIVSIIEDITLKNKIIIDKKIDYLFSKKEKKYKANKYKEVKKDPSLSAEELAEVQKRIDELEA